MTSDKEILNAFDEVEGPYATATEIAEHVDIGRKAVYKRLEDLEERDIVNRKQPVQQMVGWWRTDSQTAEQPRAGG